MAMRGQRYGRTLASSFRDEIGLTSNYAHTTTYAILPNAGKFDTYLDHPELSRCYSILYKAQSLEKVILSSLNFVRCVGALVTFTGIRNGPRNGARLG